MALAAEPTESRNLVAAGRIAPTLLSRRGRDQSMHLDPACPEIQPATHCASVKILAVLLLLVAFLSAGCFGDRSGSVNSALTDYLGGDFQVRECHDTHAGDSAGDEAWRCQVKTPNDSGWRDYNVTVSDGTV